MSDPVSFDVFSPSGVALSSARFTVSLEIDKSAVQASGRTGASQWQICYASAQPFRALPGTSGTALIGGVSYQTGLLPDCSKCPGCTLRAGSSQDQGRGRRCHLPGLW